MHNIECVSYRNDLVQMVDLNANSSELTTCAFKFDLKPNQVDGFY